MLIFFFYRSYISNSILKMKRFIVLAFLMFNIGLAYCTDFTKIDNQSESVPPNLKTVTEISHYLTKNLTSKTDKARAIYYWITHNIKYDVEQTKSNYIYADFQELVTDALLKRKGVCSNYAALFQACCQSVGIQSYAIEGYIRQNGKLILIGHMWNAINVDNQFYNIDATWAAGYVEKGKFFQQFRDEQFMVSPSEFIKTHMPLDPIWQFSANPISFKDFDTNNFENHRNSSFCNFSDSIKIIANLSSLENLKREKSRIIRDGLSNKVIIEKITEITTDINNKELEIETIKFNSGVKLFNDGVLAFNKYIANWKNIQFISAKSAPKLLETLISAREKTLAASDVISKIRTKDLKLTSEITTFNNSIEKELISINMEIDSVNHYLKN